MSISASLLPEFDQEMANTRKALERMPDDKFDWKPHEKSGTMGWLANHLANLPSWTLYTINQDSLDLAPPDGESFAAVAERVGRAVEALRDAYPGETVVVVSHVSPIKLVLRDALAAGDAFLHRLYLDTAGISLLDLYPDGGVAVRSVNDTAHLTGL